jgi:outer membrane cobalamin receptor
MLSFLKRVTDYTDTSMFIPYDNKYIEREIVLVFKGDLLATKRLNLDYKASCTSGFLKGIDYIRPFSSLGEISRKVYKLGGGARYQQDIGKASLKAGISQAWDFVGDSKYPSMSATATAAYNNMALGPVKFLIGVTLSYAGTFRLPGLAELHWKEDVFIIANPNLNPEKSRSVSSEIFSEYQMFGKWRLSVEYRDIHYKDLIYWRRSQGIKYKPVNVSASDYFGTTALISYQSPGEVITVDFSRVKSTSLNREEGQPYYGKYITFQPFYTNRLMLSLSCRGLYAKTFMFDSSHRYFLEENTKKLNAYTLINLKIGFNVTIRRVTANLEFKIDNITNAEYELLEYQPMPPRNFCFGLSLKI